MNPKRPASGQPPDPCVMVIFGASGDLTKRKLIPALCNLAADNLLSKQFAIIGFAGNDYTTESFRKTLGDEIPKYSATRIDPARARHHVARVRDLGLMAEEEPGFPKDPLHLEVVDLRVREDPARDEPLGRADDVLKGLAVAEDDWPAG